MDENEKPLSEKPYWSCDMIALVAVNLLFLGLIGFGLVMVYQALLPQLEAWLGRVMGL